MLQLLVCNQDLPVLSLGGVKFVEIQMIPFLDLNQLFLHLVEQLVVKGVLLALLLEEVAQLLVLVDLPCELHVVFLQKKNLLVKFLIVALCLF